MTNDPNDDYAALLMTATVELIELRAMLGGPGVVFTKEQRVLIAAIQGATYGR